MGGGRPQGMVGGPLLSSLPALLLLLGSSILRRAIISESLKRHARASSLAKQRGSSALSMGWVGVGRSVGQHHGRECERPGHHDKDDDEEP
jgi:hypothetical protein